jgi:hypothetical protein
LGHHFAGVGMWFFMSWACVFVFLFASDWEVWMLMYVVSAVAATGCAWAFFSPKKMP